MAATVFGSGPVGQQLQHSDIGFCNEARADARSRAVRQLALDIRNGLLFGLFRQGARGHAMKVPAASADAFAAAPPDDIRGLLIYGPDLGLVRERAETAAKAIAGSLSDPFNNVEFTPAALREEPSRLTDEACALSMMGGRRVVRLREATDAVAGAATDAWRPTARR